MELVLTEELAVVGYAALFGVGVGILYDVFRVLRLIFRPSAVAVFVEDLIFFFITAWLTGMFIFTFHSGVIRLYIFVSAVAGAALWYMTFGRISYRLWRRVSDKIRRFFAVLSAPLRKIFAKFKQKLAQKRQEKQKKEAKNTKKLFHFRKKHTIIEESKYAYVQKERMNRRES